MALYKFRIIIIIIMSGAKRLKNFAVVLVYQPPTTEEMWEAHVALLICETEWNVHHIKCFTHIEHCNIIIIIIIIIIIKDICIAQDR